MTDVVIRGGLTFDGRGGAPVHPDIAIEGDRIVQVGTVAARGRDEIDAAGFIVTRPGRLIRGRQAAPQVSK
jgi:N-acyl-D-amino-acid deacylase